MTSVFMTSVVMSNVFMTRDVMTNTVAPPIVLGCFFSLAHFYNCKFAHKIEPIS